MPSSTSFKKLLFTASDLDNEYSDCMFVNCTFNELHLGKINFDRCTFMQCNLSLCKMKATAWCDVKFLDCKMTGIEFTNCNNYTLSLSFSQCNLQYATFRGLNLQGTQFEGCQMQGADFSEANLKSAFFNNCDLATAIFSKTNLEKADFSTAFNFDINPVYNKLRQAIFSRSGLEGLLSDFEVIVVD